MPRRARLRLAGLPVHIIQRGNNRSSCFAADSDYRLYLALIGELTPRFECELHAYVLMTNHAHLLMSPRDPQGASHLMKHLGQRYVQHVNRAYGRTGSLWEGRFRSSIVDSDGYLLRCYRYIECNPVRAGMVRDPAAYPWSSYHVNALGNEDRIVTPHAQYLSLGPDEASRKAAYLRLFEGEMPPAELARIRDAANGGFALGSERFMDELERALGRKARRTQGRVVPPRGTGGLSPV